MVYLFCGQKGSGKTLFCVSYLLKNKKKYTHFFSNFPVSFCNYIDNYDWVNLRFPKGSAILIDEAQLYFNSREFSKLTKNGIGMELLDYLTMCRHYEVDIFFITQSSNRIDLQIRELSDYVFYMKKTFKIFGKPFLSFGLEFVDIMEFEKYINPNNFGNEFQYRFLLKIIGKEALKCYDTHFISNSYYEKEKVALLPYSDVAASATSLWQTINNFIKKILFNIRRYYFIKKTRKRMKKNFEDGNYFDNFDNFDK